MKYLTQFCIASIFIASCSSNNNKAANKDSSDAHAADTGKITTTAPAVSSLCFLKTEGKDTTSIELVTKDTKVTGIMNWLPYQKDSRKGTLDGIVKGDTINAVWSFMQEGMKDTLNLKFVLKNGELMQKPLKLNTKTGREQTDETAGYTTVYQAYNKVKH
ncbi:hypothetical protein KXD93_17830 [Mucilaginibacter sp. BJC16-A38]|uniref:hypothetical protein n=1 Tax=Mucilaginibacter phenanthrenivorans TaxID=1234842 RepID=UPI0021578B36|nr:hypothetical protein [Mucilaginibacter phenanthrenivorans]MCR8559522.1 hypothetical protein [Mucilaginibacter phenanthrenivorans]